MSDHEHDEHGAGAHEVDNMPSRRLFNLLFGLSGLTLLACIGVVQLFNQQVESITDSRATKSSFQLDEYQAEMAEIEKGGRLIINDDDGVPAGEGGKGPHEATRYQMPIADARKRMLEAPDKYLKAARPYRGWRPVDGDAGKAQPAPKGAAPQIRRGGRPSGAAPGALPPGVRVVPGGANGRPAPPKPRPVPAKPQ